MIEISTHEIYYVTVFILKLKFKKETLVFSLSFYKITNEIKKLMSCLKNEYIIYYLKNINELTDIEVLYNILDDKDEIFLIRNKEIIPKFQNFSIDEELINIWINSKQIPIKIKEFLLKTKEMPKEDLQNLKEDKKTKKLLKRINK